MLKYGEFVWPNDPEKLCIRHTRKVDVSPAEDGGWSVKNIAFLGRSFEGEGVFYGDTAYEALKQLAQSLNSGRAQLLKHPKWEEAQCILTELETVEERQANFLRYRFKLVEVPA